MHRNTLGFSPAGKRFGMARSAVGDAARILSLAAVLILCEGCQGMLPLSSDASGIAEPDPCGQAWGQMTPDQRLSEGATFGPGCHASAWLARCVDGYIDRAQSSGQLCFGHTGVAHAIERR